MNYHNAKVADIIRSSQRDETFINELQDYLTSVIKLLGIRNYHRFRKALVPLTTSWYYLLTSMSNLQTLGEEYTGTLRLNRNNELPKNNTKLLWFILYVGGDTLYEKILNTLETKVTESKELQSDSKKIIIKCIKFLKLNKTLLIRLHHSIFYVNARYYNISNRIAGIKYVLLRQWLQDDTSTKSFNILGTISMVYLAFLLLQNFLAENNSADDVVALTNSSGKTCILCVENRKNSCATLCGHLFCWECIYDSLKYQQTCPICREEVQPSRIVFLQNYM